MLKRIFLTEKNIMTAILLNAVIVFFMYFPQIPYKGFLELLDQGFLLFFLIEVMVKIYYLKPKEYFSIGWNRFDFTLVILSMPTLLVHVIDIPDTSYLLLLRMFRLVRVVRFIRFIPNLEKIMDGLGRALRASVFVLIALLVLNFLLALFACHFYGETAEEYFGNPLIAAYSIFQLFTIEGWNEIAADTIASIPNPILSAITRIFFVLIVLIGGIFGLSLANAVFVDEMTIDNNQALEKKIDSLQEEIKELKALIEQGT